MLVKNFEEKIIDLPEAIIHCRTDGIIHVTFKEKTELDVKLQLQMLDMYIDICGDIKRPFIFDSASDFFLTKEARDNSEKIEPRFPAVATAIIIKSIAERLVANFYLKINKPKVPTKMFTDITVAIKWLNSF